MMIILMENLYMKMTNKITGLLLSCGILFALSLHAQPSAPTAIQQQQNFQKNMEQRQPLISLKPGTNAPEIYQGENADVGPQHILRLLPLRTWLMARADSEYLYSDNLLLTQNNKSPGTEFVNSIQAAFAPTAYKVGPGRFSPQAGYLSQWFNYGLGGPSTAKGGGPINAVDFNVQTFYGSAKYQFPHNWTAFAEFDYNRFLSQANYEQFYTEYVPSAGVQRLFQVTDNSLLSIGLVGDYHSSWTINPPNNSQDRADGIFSVSYAWQITPRIVVQPYYQFQYTYYHRNNPVHDNQYQNSFGLSAAYYFTPNLSLRTFVSDAINQTDDPLVQKYHACNFGADLAYTIRF
jgi:hypothetical protein